MRYRNTLNRRSLLRGAFGSAIALPFLEEMTSTKAQAADKDPLRCVTLSFGLGMSQGNQRERFTGPLAPYQRFSNKMAFFTDVDMQQARGGVAHVEGSTVLFVGERKRSGDRSGGASIEQIFRHALTGQGGGARVGTLATGLWFREQYVAEPLRCWNADGTNAARPIKRPSEVFKTLFGGMAPTAPPIDTQSIGQARRKGEISRSILDAVVGEYRFLTGDASYLGQSSKQKIAHHLDRIREVERQLVPADAAVANIERAAAACGPPVAGDPDLDGNSYDLKGATDRAAPRLSLATFEKVIRLQADLLALGLRCDLVRFGSFLCESSGGHFKFTGTYQALGGKIDFNGDNSEHADFWHDNRPAQARICTHLFQSQLAYLLGLLDDPAFPEKDGRTLLDNTVAMVGTEVGWNHDLTQVFHAVAGGQGRFRPGFYDDKVNCVDIYNTVLEGFNIDAKVGQKSGISPRRVPGLLG